MSNGAPTGAMSDLPRDARIFVAGHRGMVGSAIVRALQAAGHRNLVLRTHAELDLRDRVGVQALYRDEKPEYVVLAAARVGGILANDTYRGEFIHDNLAIQINVMDEAYRSGVKRVLFLGSSCIYPKHALQPLKEEYLLTGPLEHTNRPYAIAKIAGIEMCDAYRRQYGCDFRAAMPTNLYGPGDTFELSTAHVIPALIRKFHEANLSGAPSVTVWGTGTPRREFLHVDDVASACLLLLGLPRETWDAQIGHPFVNVGAGTDLTIRELAELVAQVVGYSGKPDFDATKPDGTPRKLMDPGRMLGLGWRPAIGLSEGLRNTYRWYQEQLKQPTHSAAAACEH